MHRSYSTSLFIFRRDLRLYDNAGLNAALTNSKRVFAAFVFDPEQIEPHAYQSRFGLNYLLEAVQDLQEQLRARGARLHLFYAAPIQVLSVLHRRLNLAAVFVNRDYTPFSKRRDSELAAYCADHGLGFFQHADALLNEPEAVVKADGGRYQVFTAFYRQAHAIPVAQPRELAAGEFVIDAVPEEIESPARFAGPCSSPLRGGRAQALQRLQQLSKLVAYSLQRDFPALEQTSGLSADLKFGCCSIREAYFAAVLNLGSDHALLRQFYWRDFFYHIAVDFPHVFGHAFQPRFDHLSWRNDLAEFEAWAAGRTGFPIVDAGMRQLNQTGMLPNRLRMIVASFLVKDLHVSWRWGERYFAQRLVDYDPCLNNGNWQWAASTGCDAQPYFRIFNPWLQQKKYDPDCAYISRWLPELAQFAPHAIHNWHINPLACDYPPPMLDHAERSRQAKVLFHDIASDK